MISFTGSLTRAAGETVVESPYAIGIGSVTNSNYTIAYTGDNFAITPLAVTVTANAGQTKIYGSVDPALTFTSSPVVGTALANTEVISFTGSLVRVTGENVGSYSITVGGLNNMNLSITLVTDNFIITKAPLTITADNQSKTYGASNPLLTISYSGFVNGEDVSVITEPLISTSTVTGSDAGTYPITLSGGDATNYTLTLADGVMTVNKATLTVTADNKVKSYGDFNPTLTFVIAGFIGTDDKSVIDVTPSVTTTASQTTNAGTYDIVPAGGTDNNYQFTYINGSLTISQISQIITFTDIPANLLVKDVYSIAASSTSGLTVLFESVNPQFATVNGNQLDGVSRGTARIRAYNPGDQNYLPAEIFADVVIISTHKDILHLFTPNNDGFNDTWEIPDMPSYGKCDVKVYNRWGQMVYANKYYDNLWDGTSNGKPLPDGAYYFIIKTENSGTITGTVNIVR